MVRIVLAGILGGAVIFVCGAVEHMVFQWADRQFKRPPSETALVEFVKAQKFEAGLYGFPDMPRDTPKDQQEKVYEEINKRYKEGPNGILLVGPVGEDMMGPRQLGFEGASNVAMAFIAAWILSLLAPGTNYYTRWVVVLFIGVAAWLSIDASYAIWYRFPWPFIRDQLLCVLLEWGVGGLVIAAIVKPQGTAAPL